MWPPHPQNPKHNTLEAMITYTISSAGWHAGGRPVTRLRALDAAADAPWLHRWFTEPRAAFWGMQHHTPGEVEAVYAEMMRSGRALACVGEINGRDAFVLECYDPAHDEIGRHYDVQPGDVGMHFFVGPAEAGGLPIHGFTRHVFQSLMRFIFEQLRAERVVVEPDIRNTKVHALNAAMGFEVHGPLTLPHKTALLSSCTPAQFRRATASNAAFITFPIVQPTTEDSAA